MLKIPFGESELTIDSGELARQATSAVVVRHGETVALVTVTVATSPKEGADFFPLTVDYEERLYAAGKISGSKFIKRENRPSEEAVLKGRVADRAIRPMFPKTFRREIQIIITTLSYDEAHDPAAMAIVGASAALLRTDTPFAGPIGAVRVGMVDGEFVLNPTEDLMEKSPLDLVVAGSEERITMIEASASELEEEKMLQAILFAHQAIREITQAQATLSQETPSEPYEEPAIHHLVDEALAADLKGLAREPDRQKRQQKMTELNETAQAKFGEEHDPKEIAQAVDHGFFKAIRQLILKEGTRPDGRAFKEIRPISIKTGLLPRVHGSGLFTRGETQALTVATLGGPGEEQWIDTMEEEARKRYMHHYNFPPYATGEVKPLRGSNRREIGHGALAEKALLPVLPSREEFPYTIRLVSETLSSNGSSSMAAVCGSTLALMDAGVPIRAPVAGVAMGLVADDDLKEYRLLTDLQGLEDFAGEMDFKIAGSKTGITAIQLDVKNRGLNEPIISDTLLTAKEARLTVLEKIAEVLSAPRPELSKYAPRIITARIDPTKIGEVIGPGGKTINKIIEAQGGREVISVDIDDDGTVMITSADSAKAAAVKEIIESIGTPLEVGQEFEGEVTQIMKDRNSGKEIGAIVQLTANRDGMIHISALGSGRFVNRVTDVVKVGERLKVKINAIDQDRGRISLVRCPESSETPKS